MRNVITSVASIRVILDAIGLALLGILVFGTMVSGTVGFLTWVYSLTILYVVAVWFFLHLPMAGVGGILPFATPVQQRHAIFWMAWVVALSIMALVALHNAIFGYEVTVGILATSAILASALDGFAAHRLITA